jgi:hypothetical protein
MCASDQVNRNRARLNFPEVVADRFTFLTDYSFARVHMDPTLVVYRNGNLTINIYHGRGSFEVGFEICPDNERYSMSQIIRAIDPTVAEQYRNRSAATPPEVQSAVDRLAALVSQYADRALRNDPTVFEVLRRQQAAWAETYAMDVLEQQVRPKAEAAFREGHYKEAAELYDRIHERLSPAELMKLDISRKRSM